MRTLKVVYPNILDVRWFSHTIHNMGQHFHTPTLDRFVSARLSMFSHSPKARLAWKSRTERAMVGYSETRWWSNWEVAHQVLVQFGDVQAFLKENTDIAPANNNKQPSIFQNPQDAMSLQVELAITIDVSLVLRLSNDVGAEKRAW